PRHRCRARCKVIHARGALQFAMRNVALGFARTLLVSYPALRCAEPAAHDERTAHERRALRVAVANRRKYVPPAQALRSRSDRRSQGPALAGRFSPDLADGVSRLGGS